MSDCDASQGSRIRSSISLRRSDLEGDSTLVGKAIGKDAAAGKATMVSVLGVDAAKVRLQQLVAEAEQALAPFGSGATILIEAAKFVAERRA